VECRAYRGAIEVAHDGDVAQLDERRADHGVGEGGAISARVDCIGWSRMSGRAPNRRKCANGVKCDAGTTT
jgi:hypothetical protein